MTLMELICSVPEVHECSELCKVIEAVGKEREQELQFVLAYVDSIIGKQSLGVPVYIKEYKKYRSWNANIVFFMLI